MNKGFTINKLIYRPDMATNNVIGQQYKGKDISKDSKQKAHIGDGITLTIGRRSGDPLPTVPKVVGLTLNEAKGRLIEEGFNIGDIHTTEKINKAKMGSAMVYRQIPGPDVRLDFGAKVTLYLSQDPKLVNSSSQQTDNLLRMAEEEAARNSAN